MTALTQLASVLRALPMDEAGRKASEELIAAAQREQQGLVQALVQCRNAALALYDEETNARAVVASEAISAAEALLSRFPEGETIVRAGCTSDATATVVQLVPEGEP